jgi:hypothetical protein
LIITYNGKIDFPLFFYLINNSLKNVHKAIKFASV